MGQGDRILNTSAGKIQIALLKEKPSAAARSAVLKLESEEDCLELDGRASPLYWPPRTGQTMAVVSFAGALKEPSSRFTTQAVVTSSRSVVADQ